MSALTQRDVTRRYDRIAGLYDLYNGPMEWFGMRRRRRRLLAKARGSVLEVGIGTGRNLGHYPEVALIGVDASARMLARAVDRSPARDGPLRAVRGDAQQLPFAGGSFDTVTATCVFCSVADPVRGLAEVARVVRPGGCVLLLEHVRPRSRVLGWFADLINPLTRRAFGFNINRRTEDNIRTAGLRPIDVRRGGIWREIVAEVQPDRRRGVPGSTQLWVPACGVEDGGDTLVRMSQRQVVTARPGFDGDVGVPAGQLLEERPVGDAIVLADHDIDRRGYLGQPLGAVGGEHHILEGL